MDLTKKHCVPCEGGTPPLDAGEIARYMGELRAWELVDNQKIKRSFRFVNFRQTMDFVNKVAEIAESEGHHPDMLVSYGACTLELSTHAIHGLSENDFIMAAKIDQI